MKFRMKIININKMMMLPKDLFSEELDENYINSDK